MKSKFVCISVLFGSLLTAAVPGFAESLELRVPFEFEAGGKTLPAGEYTVTTVGNILTMHGVMPGATLTMLVEIVDWSESASPKASFEGSGMKTLMSVTLANGTTCVPFGAKRLTSEARPLSGDVLLSRH